MRLEEALGRLEALGLHRHEAAVGQLVPLQQVRRLVRQPMLHLEIACHVTQLLLHRSHSVEVGSRVERVAARLHQLYNAVADEKNALTK